MSMSSAARLTTRFHHRLGSAHKGYHCAVGGLARVYVEQFHALSPVYHIHNLIDDIHIAPFAEVGHTFNKSVHVG